MSTGSSSSFFLRRNRKDISVLDLEAAQGFEAGIDIVRRVVVGAVLEALAAHRTQPLAGLLAEWRDRLGELDRLAYRRLEVELVMVGKSERLVLLARLRLNRRPGVDVDRGQDLFIERDLDRNLDVDEAAAALGFDRCLEARAYDQAAVRSGEADMTFDRFGEAEVVAEVDRGTGDFVVASGTRIIGEAEEDAEEVRRGADEYAVNVLVGLEGDVVKTLQSIKKGIALLDERRSSLGSEETDDGDDGGAGERWEDEAAEPSSTTR